MSEKMIRWLAFRLPRPDAGPVGSEYGFRDYAPCLARLLSEGPTL